MINTLCQIGEKINNENLLWGVGASLLLNQYGLIEKPNDIDLMVSLEDIDRTDTILKGIGERKEKDRKPCYSTRVFYEYVINSIDIDVMAGFGILHNKGVYEYPFSQESITEHKIINGVRIPFTSLEDWYVFYQLMPNRESKVKLIENYLLSNGIKHPALLELALARNLPDEVIFRTRRLSPPTPGMSE
jgi:hypothetical protein